MKADGILVDKSEYRKQEVNEMWSKQNGMISRQKAAGSIDLILNWKWAPIQFNSLFYFNWAKLNKSEKIHMKNYN